MKKFEPATGPVNVNRYTIYAMIPGLDTYVFSKLNKKKQALFITIISIVALLIFTGIVMYQMITDTELQLELDKDVRVEITYQKYMLQIISIIVGFLVIYLPIVAYLIRMWAQDWNKKFDSPK